MLDQFNKSRDKKGYINLDSLNISFINRNTYGSRDKRWFRYEGNDYLFKANKGPLEDIKEIINEEIAKALNINNALYDIAILNGQTGVITKDFVNGMEFIPILCLCCEYNNVHNNIYNICNALYAISVREENIQSIKSSILNEHILDIFTCQYDRNFKNIALLYNGKDHYKAPRYDSAGSFLNISKLNKIQSFIDSSEKEKFFEKYNGCRTKLRIFKGDIRQNSIDELLEAYYCSELGRKFLDKDKNHLEDFINQISALNLNEIYKYLSNYNICLNNIYQDYFKKIIYYKLREYEKKKQKYK